MTINWLKSDDLSLKYKPNNNDFKYYLLSSRKETRRNHGLYERSLLVKNSKVNQGLQGKYKEYDTIFSNPNRDCSSFGTEFILFVPKTKTQKENVFSERHISRSEEGQV